MVAGGAGGGARGRGVGAGGGGSGPPRAPGGAPPARPRADGLPPEFLEAVARAVPACGSACRSWAAAGAKVVPATGEEPLPRRKVTRTRGPDPAASAACVAEVMVGAVEEPLRREFWNDLCACSAQGGHLAVLQWARAHERPLNKTTCARAAENGHLEVLEWAGAHGCPRDESTCAGAAQHGHLEVLQSARSNKYP